MIAVTSFALAGDDAQARAAGAILFAGSALDASEVRNGVLTKTHARNAFLVTSRVRFSF